MTYYVYILTNACNSVLYIGATNNLIKRVVEHKQGKYDGFTKKYNVHKLVHYGEYSRIEDAIQREKPLKKWKRKWKEELVERDDYFYKDLSEKWLGDSHFCRNDR